MPTQHIATILGAACCVRLAIVLRHVATCWVLLAHIFKLEPTTPNMLQLIGTRGQTHTTSCAQQCCDMLRWHVAVVWPELKGGWYTCEL